MRLQDSVKPISYVKAHAAEIIRDVAETRTPIVITQNGEAKAVLLDIASYEETQESMALLKILALSQRDVEAGMIEPAEKVFADLREEFGKQQP